MPADSAPRHDQESGLFFAAEYLIIRLDNPLGDELLAMRGIKDFDGTILGTPGAFIGSGSRALSTKDASQEKWSPGYRFTLGWRFENDMSIYANYMQMVTNRSVATASLCPARSTWRPTSPTRSCLCRFFNYSAFFAGPDADVVSQVSGADVPAYGIFNAAEQVLIQLEQKMWSWEITGKFPVQLVEGCRTYCLAGPRFMYLEEHFKFRITDLTLNGELANTNVALILQRLDEQVPGRPERLGHGNDLGGGVGVTLEGRLGLFANIRKGSNKLERGDRGVHDTIEGYGFNDIGVSPMFQLAPTWSGSRSRAFRSAAATNSWASSTPCEAPSRSTSTSAR